MMKSSDSRQSDDLGRRRGPIFDSSASWRILKASEDAILVVVRSVLPEQSTQMNLVEYHNVIEQFSAH
jgi:hypothetical protein